ncbi:helix-turn-helix domain-containing protein [Kaistella palustris]|uniref:helix-turn-helix domain-containing protein n=1 Tax=Kaistella palustris TaxID=493376 RepID=UPI0003FAAE4C|nr:helix-turn-helix domain-containing protein [Kaistella palustris]
MIYRVFHPCPELSDVVEYYWYSKVDLENAAVQLYATPLLQGMAFNFKQQSEHHEYNGQTVTLSKQAYIFGQPTCPRVITTSEKGVDIIGVKFKALGISKITGINMEHMADQIIAAEDIWPVGFDFLCDEMQSAPSLEATVEVLEKFLCREMYKTSVHYRIQNAQNAVALITGSCGQLEIADVQNMTNTSRKTLERAFLNYLGLTPKFYARIIRFNALKEYLVSNPQNESLTSLAYDHGFYDSSHLSAEFKRFSGCTPTGFLKTLPREVSLT